MSCISGRLDSRSNSCLRLRFGLLLNLRQTIDLQTLWYLLQWAKRLCHQYFTLSPTFASPNASHITYPLCMLLCHLMLAYPFFYMLFCHAMYQISILHALLPRYTLHIYSTCTICTTIYMLWQNWYSLISIIACIIWDIILTIISIVGRYVDPHRWPQARHEIEYLEHTRWILKDSRKRTHNLTWLAPNLAYVHGERS